MPFIGPCSTCKTYFIPSYLLPMDDSLYSLQNRFDTLARLDRRYFHLANRIRLARYLIEAGVKQNLKYLMGINLNSLKKQQPKAPDQDAREYFTALTEEAKSGPIFTEESLMAVQHAGDQLNKDKAKSLADMISRDDNPDLDSLDLVIQWLVANTSSLPPGTAYSQVVERIMQEGEDAIHAPSIEEDPMDPRTSDEGRKLIVYSFKNGYFITKVPVGAPREYEGEAMGHCVGSNYRDVATLTILSLRNPRNNPRVTISLTNPGDELVELRGRQNALPVPRYMKYIKEFMGTGIVKENIVYWGLFNKPKFIEALKTDKSHLAEIALNQTPFTGLLAAKFKMFPLAVTTNQNISDSERNEYLLYLLKRTGGEGLSHAVRDIKKMAESAYFLLTKYRSELDPATAREAAAGILAGGKVSEEKRNHIESLFNPSVSDLVSLIEGSPIEVQTRIVNKILSASDNDGIYYLLPKLNDLHDSLQRKVISAIFSDRGNSRIAVRALRMLSGLKPMRALVLDLASSSSDPRVLEALTYHLGKLSEEQRQEAMASIMDPDFYAPTGSDNYLANLLSFGGLSDDQVVELVSRLSYGLDGLPKEFLTIDNPKAAKALAERALDTISDFSGYVRPSPELFADAYALLDKANDPKRASEILRRFHKAAESSLIPPRIHDEEARFYPWAIREASFVEYFRKTNPRVLSRPSAAESAAKDYGYIIAYYSRFKPVVVKLAARYLGPALRNEYMGSRERKEIIFNALKSLRKTGDLDINIDDVLALTEFVPEEVVSSAISTGAFRALEELRRGSNRRKTTYNLEMRLDLLGEIDPEAKDSIRTYVEDPEKALPEEAFAPDIDDIDKEFRKEGNDIALYAAIRSAAEEAAALLDPSSLVKVFGMYERLREERGIRLSDQLWNEFPLYVIKAFRASAVPPAFSRYASIAPDADYSELVSRLVGRKTRTQDRVYRAKRLLSLFGYTRPDRRNEGRYPSSIA